MPVSHLLLVAVLAPSIYSQLIMKSRALVHLSADSPSAVYLQLLIGMATDRWVLSAAGSTFLAGVCWLLALSFVMIPVAANLFPGESIPMIWLPGFGFVLGG